MTKRPLRHVDFVPTLASFALTLWLCFYLIDAAMHGVSRDWASYAKLTAALLFVGFYFGKAFYDVVYPFADQASFWKWLGKKAS